MIARNDGRNTFKFDAACLNDVGSSFTATHADLRQPLHPTNTPTNTPTIHQSHQRYADQHTHQYASPANGHADQYTHQYTSPANGHTDQYTHQYADPANGHADQYTHQYTTKLM